LANADAANGDFKVLTGSIYDFNGRICGDSVSGLFQSKRRDSGPEKIRELARRGEAWGDSESRQMLEYAIQVGRGGVYLRLAPAQYAKPGRP